MGVQKMRKQPLNIHTTTMLSPKESAMALRIISSSDTSPSTEKSCEWINIISWKLQTRKNSELVCQQG